MIKINLHPIAFTVVLILVFHSSLAQSPLEKVTLFTYDRNQVDKIMEQINEGTVSAGSGFSVVQVQFAAELLKIPALF